MTLTNDDLAKRCAVAERIARRAGEMLSTERRAMGQVPFEVKGQNDIVTRMDRASEDFIVAELHRAFPEDDILAEEDGLRRYGGLGRWIIDPIDGTENYVRGFPHYAVSIGFEEEEGQPVAGVVYCPPTNEMFTASRGRGAFLNGEPIRVSRRSEPAQAVSVVSPPFRMHEFADEYYELYKRVFYQTCDVRNTGSAALHTCYVAAGMAEGHFEKGVHSFDIAAGLAIVTEAGGKWSSLYGEGHPYDRHEILLTNGLLHEWYARLAREVRAEFSARRKDG